MAESQVKITDIVVRNLPAPPTGAKVYVDDQLTGFGVRVTAKGVKAFILTYGTNRERITLGRYPLLSLHDGRKEAQRVLAERTLGKIRPKRLTFEDALVLFLETRKAKNRLTSVKQSEKILRGHFKSLMRMNLEDIRVHHITDITDALSKRGVQSTAAHAHREVKTFLKWCAQRQYITANPIAELEMPTLPKTRVRILTDDELKKIWLATEKDTPFHAIIRLCMLTGQRRGELSQARWSWLANNTLTIPSEISKNKQVHVFPVGSLALTCLLNSKHKACCGTFDTANEKSNSSRLFFPALGNDTKPFNSWSEAKRALDKRSGVTNWKIHDARKTYATTLQRLGVKLEVIESILNHKSGTRSGIVGVYQKYSYDPEMREAVTTFETFFTKVITSE